MNEITFHILVLIAPLIISNVLHMLVVKYNYLPGLCMPLHTKAFGNNKTLRGFIVVPVMNALVLFTLATAFKLHVNQALFNGLLLGMAYMASELPNSYLKRRLGIEPGGTHKQYGKLFKLLDKMDSAFGVSLMYMLLGFADPLLALFLFLLSSFTHIVFSQLLYVFKIKKSF